MLKLTYVNSMLRIYIHYLSLIHSCLFILRLYDLMYARFAFIQLNKYRTYFHQPLYLYWFIKLDMKSYWVCIGIQVSDSMTLHVIQKLLILINIYNAQLLLLVNSIVVFILQKSAHYFIKSRCIICVIFDGLHHEVGFQSQIDIFVVVTAPDH